MPVSTESMLKAVSEEVDSASTVTRYREPLVAVAAADDPRFEWLRREIDPAHALPQELLPGAASVVSFFIPFDGSVVAANSRERESVAREWAVAYVETNALIASVVNRLSRVLADTGASASADPATGVFDRDSLRSRWFHKSVAVIAGLGSFGLHQMVITDAGCAGRLGSLVTDAVLVPTTAEPVERCAYRRDGSCTACAGKCPVEALSTESGLDRRRCWARCRSNAEAFRDVGHAEVCGKCVSGPCAMAPF